MRKLNGTMDNMSTEKFRAFSITAQPVRTPVALFVFRRPETTRRVFDAISKAQPTKLLLIADGPRPDRKGEAEACRQVREIVTRVDWPCEVFQNFSDTNLDCGDRIISGLDWVFSLVEEAIILEDDCLPDPSFFSFCQELLERYRGDRRIAYISGNNFVEKYTVLASSYYFSQIGGTWGWATWRSEWQRFDRYLSGWPDLKRDKILEEVFDRPQAVKYLTRIFDQMYADTPPDVWDYQWLYAGLKSNSLAIVPRVNLVTNIGFGEGSTHTTSENLRLMFAASSIEFPLKHPISFLPLRSLDRLRVQDMFPRSIFHRIAAKRQRMASNFFQ
jgi:hypothetical protein